jgi:hypothetical protein
VTPASEPARTYLAPDETVLQAHPNVYVSAAVETSRDRVNTRRLSHGNLYVTNRRIFWTTGLDKGYINERLIPWYEWLWDPGFAVQEVQRRRAYLLWVEKESSPFRRAPGGEGYVPASLVRILSEIGPLDAASARVFGVDVGVKTVGFWMKAWEQLIYSGNPAIKPTGASARLTRGGSWSPPIQKMYAVRGAGAGLREFMTRFLGARSAALTAGGPQIFGFAHDPSLPPPGIAPYPSLAASAPPAQGQPGPPST